MGHQIIKQPNGQFSVWSTVVDNLIILDATPEEIIEYYCAREREEITQRVHDKVEQLNKGESPYGQFTMDWEEALDMIESCHGKDDNTFKIIEEVKANESA